MIKFETKTTPLFTKFLRKSWILLFLIPLFFLLPSKKFDGWTHLELGGGNYGPDGHTRSEERRVGKECRL